MKVYELLHPVLDSLPRISSLPLMQGCCEGIKKDLPFLDTKPDLSIFTIYNL